MAAHFGGRWTINNEKGVILIQRLAEDEEVVVSARVTADEGREIAALLVKRADEIDAYNESVLHPPKE